MNAVTPNPGHVRRADPSLEAPLPPTDPREADAKACRHLWGAVLIQCLRDALVPQGASTARKVDTWKAREWIGTRDFYEVCNLAGIPGPQCEAWARSEMAKGRSTAFRKMQLHNNGRSVAPPV